MQPNYKITNKSTLSTEAYIALSGLFVIVGFLFFHTFLFRNLGNLSFPASCTVLMGSALLSMFLSAFWINRNRLNTWTVLTAPAVPYGIYAVITYRAVFGTAFQYIVGIPLCIAVFCALCALTAPENGPDRRLRFRIRLIKGERTIRSAVAASLMLILCLVSMPDIFGFSILPTDTALSGTETGNPEPNETSATAPSTTDGANTGSAGTSTGESITGSAGRTIENNMETVLRMQERIWRSLDATERLNTLQILADIEATYLGLPDTLTVEIQTLSGNTVAQYSDSDRTVIIDRDHLENDPAEDVLDSLCHEAFHSAQYRLTDVRSAADNALKNLYGLRTAARYEAEFRHYISGSDDFDTYYGQRCEEDARAYAAERVDEYYSAIATYTLTASET